MPDIWLKTPSGMWPAKDDAEDHDHAPCFVRLRDYRALLDRAERARAALAAAPQPAPEDDWRNDPSADERWNAGCDYAMTALCKLLRINTDDVTWDAATEELEGDVLAVLGDILTVRFGDDWRKAAPQPAPVDREALVGWLDREFSAWNETSFDTPLTDYLADALLARGLCLPGGDETMAWAVLDENGGFDVAPPDRERESADGWLLLPGERLVRVAIRVVEGGDDAA